MPSKTVKTIRRANGKHIGLYLAPDGSWLSAGTYGDKAVARVSATAAYQKARQADWVNPRGSRTLLANYAEDTWFPSLTVADSTRVSYDSTYRTHIKPVFGAREMGAILYTEVTTWLALMETNGVGRATQRKAYVVLTRVLKSARRDRLITVLPTDDVQTRPIPVRDVTIFNKEQREKFLAEVPEAWLSLVTVGFETGMRLEEMRALTPSQINWSGSIYIDRATVQLSEKNGGFKDKETKGKTNRRIKVEPAAMKILAEATKAAGLLPTSTEKIFGLFRTEAIEAVFEVACEKAGIPRRTPKHMRSTKASWMLQETGDLMAVKDYLGHADISTTQKYLAALETHDEDNVISFEDYFRDEQAPLKEAK